MTACLILLALMPVASSASGLRDSLSNLISSNSKKPCADFCPLYFSNRLPSLSSPSKNVTLLYPLPKRSLAANIMFFANSILISGKLFLAQSNFSFGSLLSFVCLKITFSFLFFFILLNTNLFKY